MTAIDEAKAYLGTLPDWIREFEAQTVIRNLLAERDATCAWTEHAVSAGFWSTDCGEAFEVHVGSPGQNGLRYCCFCGRRLAEGSQ